MLYQNQIRLQPAQERSMAEACVQLPGVRAGVQVVAGGCCAWANPSA